MKASPSRHWTFTCPWCRRKVRVNRNGTIAAHWSSESGSFYCEGSREPAVYADAVSATGRAEPS